ncbi:MAG: isopentenyl-diphosphate Delta-isomerase [Candidatus Pacebacteria bacterium]|nr:isopentenyl-diphosphate Delta-isomerase [Candidatus Paceibacterota bacterium]
MSTEIILVDKNDQEIGAGEKMKVHQDGKLHRCFSIFVFNSNNEMLLQKRAKAKYHCGGLWTNTCCSHPRKGELLEKEIHKRLQEEMGFDCELKEIGGFIYKAKFDNGLTEHEYDHVFTGKFDGQPKLNPEEADDYKWIGLEELKKEIKKNPEDFTVWFKIALERFF